jgi:hypothetical protein
MYTLYLDESGDHKLEKIDPQYPVFVLGGVIIRDHYSQRVIDRVRQFKREHCGGEGIILHTADICRNRNGFEFMKDRERREAFFAGMNEMMRSIPYQVVAIAIKKDKHVERYGELAQDPYHLSMEFVIERFYRHLSGQPGAIVAESRNPTLDSRLLAAYQDLLAFGTSYVNGDAIAKAFPNGIEIRPKCDNIEGLQLADLVVTPIGRHVIGKAVHEDWRIVEAHLRRGPNGGYSGYGLKVFP